jgi:Inner membrane component of T3SS, cytoplasmic domain
MANPIKTFFDWLFLSPGPQSTTIGAGRRCDAGHAMDPAWVECPYCKAERNKRLPTAGPPPRTRFDHGDSAASAERDGRRIAGVLVTFTWRKEGDLFSLHEGKNLIGSGATADRRCDVLVTKDQTVSREHALIRCLNGEYEIFDQKSENGTFLNDKPVPVNGMPLEDRSRIRTGATVWSFMSIKAPAASEKRARTAEGFGPVEMSETGDTTDRPIGAAHESPEPLHEKRRPTTVDDPADPTPRDERRGTKFFDAPADADEEIEEGEVQVPRANKAPPPEGPGVPDKGEPPARSGKGRTKFF